MRSPRIKFMALWFELIDRLKMTDKLIPYYLKHSTKYSLLQQWEARPRQIHVPTFGPFKKLLRENFYKGWLELQKYDGLSTRAYMRNQKGYTWDNIMRSSKTNNPWEQNFVNHWISWKLFSASNLYDCAFTEAVMHSLMLDDPKEWNCIQGGPIKQKLYMNKRVTAIAPAGRENDQEPPKWLEVTVSGEEAPRTYDHVISTLLLSALSMVDLSKCELPWQTQMAIRMLHHDSSVKVAIKFTRRWWEALGHRDGVYYTDRPTRVVVYPSYGIGDENLHQDAVRQDAFGHGANSLEEKILLDVILRDLVDIHQMDKQKLREMVVRHDVWNWNYNPNSTGVLYLRVTSPWVDRLHFGEEATSVFHAYVSFY
ncbi:hypothetical protein WOLCODRAFT_90368 [Wolfiporia cocos MD-104 SS10]|uniref:Amine oxidase domain-containing protein n=1 Tax=Wolfiporia cocos (strain MD-104) TaxID=742152 RepID=A0A2H3JN29_WOLCO|nr:hypothetical protein WOLCODRAFT_90368 [Wolfiporia cocos MD-104 SS10]